MPRCTSGRSRYLRRQRQLRLQRAVSGLDVDEEQALAALRPAVRLLDASVALSRRRHPPSGPGAPCATTVTRWIAGITGVDGSAVRHSATVLIELREHLLLGILAEHAHLLRVRVAVVRDDALLRQECAPSSASGPVGQFGTARLSGADRRAEGRCCRVACDPRSSAALPVSDLRNMTAAPERCTGPSAPVSSADFTIRRASSRADPPDAVASGWAAAGGEDAMAV